MKMENFFVLFLKKIFVIGRFFFEIFKFLVILFYDFDVIYRRDFFFIFIRLTDNIYV